MGEVWDAWDERLDRRVAVKRVLEDDPRHRRRLRREARVLARLRHPTIVQIHDLVEAEDGDWIVMEHCAGQTLAERLRGGPFEPSQVLAVAGEIVEGLVAAHQHGLLHRDLKSENVVLTPDGTRILDFGLAKSWWGPSDRDLAAVDLTAVDLAAGNDAGTVVGTPRAMSPEQAEGLELDPRSDLFSFGILLYELATGVSPFHAAGVADTLVRVCRHCQAPAAELNPLVPAALSELIDDLLEKERAHRPRSAREVARRLDEIGQQRIATPDRRALAEQPTLVDGTVDRTDDEAPCPERRSRRRTGLFVALGVLLPALALLLGRLPPPPALVVAVAAPEVGLGAEREEVVMMAAGVRAALLRASSALEGVAPVAAEGDTPSAETAAALARALAADEVLSSRLDCPGALCQLTLERRRGEDPSVLWVESLEVPVDDPRILITAVAAPLSRAWPEHRWRGNGEGPEFGVAAEDWARYLRVERRLGLREAGFEAERWIAELAAIRASSPRFLEAWLLEARLHALRHYDSRDPSELETALTLLRRARRLAPGDPRVADMHFSVALPAAEQEMAAALAELERQAPGDPRTLLRRAQLAEVRGMADRALELLRRAAGLRPSWRILFELANLEYRQGELAAARRTLARLRERFPDDVRPLSLWAQIELLAGDPTRAVELYGDQVERAPSLTDLTNLGTAQLLVGHWSEAAGSFRRAVALEPENPAILLNLGDAELLLGDEAAARARYRRVVELLDADPEAESHWQWLTVRAQALAHLGAARQAVASVREAERLAPRNPQVAYEAALVYALVGDDTSALVSAEKALGAGVDRRWFGFPWFDRLRAHPAFRDTEAP